MITVKVILALAATWGVPAQHGDIPKYVEASKEPHLEILQHIPSGVEVPAARMRELGVTSTKDLALELRRSLHGFKRAGLLWSQLMQERFVEGGYTQ
ncbi:unnamed protein product [Peronospora farinosa]|uniref:Uncharacterized protein n=1 Tax=Peronospora farinosa TaxID=134698 RepID=A0AAV0U9J0_9STRA|nr:unnamed protein product [Peronospora farinosa]